MGQGPPYELDSLLFLQREDERFWGGAMPGKIRADVAEDILAHCDRTRSKEARYALQRLVWEPLKALGTTLSSDCPLAREADVLREQEAQKHHHIDSLWECLLCNKKFSSEHYLDKHLARRHAAVRNDEGATCFAELCGVVVPCVPLNSELLPPVSSALLAVPVSSDVAPGESLKPFCEDSVQHRRRLHSCEEIVRQCMQHAKSSLSQRQRRQEVARLRVDLCERALEVECVPRHEVWSVLGDPSRALRPRSRGSYRNLLGLGLFLGLVVFLIVWRHRRRSLRGTAEMARRLKVRRRKGGKGY